MGVRIRSHQDVAYGLDNALQSLAPEPIISNRAPTGRDSAPLGTIWINKAGNLFYVLTSVTAGQANWEASVSGTFDSVTITGTAGTVLAVAAGGNTVLGGNLSVTGNTIMTGDLTVNGALGISVGTALILSGAGSPAGTVTAPQGSLYLNTTGSTGTTRAFINTSGGTVWTAVETVA